MELKVEHKNKNEKMETKSIGSRQVWPKMKRKETNIKKKRKIEEWKITKTTFTRINK